MESNFLMPTWPMGPNSSMLEPSYLKGSSKLADIRDNEFVDYDMLGQVWEVPLNAL